MARTPRSRPSARSGSGSAVSAPALRLILASASPRRRELLSALGLRFEVVETGVDELTAGDPASVVVENARRKARAGLAAARRQRSEIPQTAGAAAEVVVVGADTDVAIDGEILGKPASGGEARAMLHRLGGREHEVHGGIAVAREAGEKTAHTLTTVRFRELPESLIEAYVAAGAWRGFAGGYAIQGAGAALADSVEGDLANVIGLSVSALIGLEPDLLTPSTA